MLKEAFENGEQWKSFGRTTPSLVDNTTSITSTIIKDFTTFRKKELPSDHGNTILEIN
jgi:hypothetical protein